MLSSHDGTDVRYEPEPTSPAPLTLSDHVIFDSLLRDSLIPHLASLRGRRVLDVGCGRGLMARSLADIMMKFPLDVATKLNIVDTAQFPNVAARKTKIEARPAYQRMLAKARPDGLIGPLPALPKHAPPGPRGSVPAPTR